MLAGKRARVEVAACDQSLFINFVRNLLVRLDASDLVIIVSSSISVLAWKRAAGLLKLGL